MNNPDVTDNPQTPATSAPLALLGLTVTRVDFNLSRGDDKASTHFSMRMTDGAIICHGCQEHSSDELLALHLAAHEIKKHIEGAEREHRYSSADSNLKPQRGHQGVRPVLQRSGSETRRQKRMNTNETQSPGSLHPVVQPTRPWTHEQETEEMLRDCGRPEIRTCVECGENAPETGHICDECREQNGLL